VRDGAPLLERERLAELPGLLAESGADAWLLYDLADHNPLAHRLLGLEKTTRRAFALFPARAEPRLLHHAIEASAWREWPWERRSYRGWSELIGELEALLEGVEVVAMEHSPDSAVPMVDRVPGGVLDLVRATGTEIVSSGDLVTAFHSRWSDRGLALHRRAAGIVRETAMEAFRRAARSVQEGRPLGERELMDWIETRLAGEGVSEQVGCIVAVGRTASDPHYSPEGPGELLNGGELVLIDLWGALPDGGIPADQTWMGVLGPEPPRHARRIWNAVRLARDGALDFLRRSAASGLEVRGWEADEVARELLRAQEGLDRWFVHRLGHSIDADLHGSGPNLDHLETRDERRLIPGVGFSVEPGVYIPGEMGVRTEVNVYWGPEGPEITTPEPQDELLHFVPGQV
jgi:Xaa-Pro dipeptidase